MRFTLLVMLLFTVSKIISQTDSLQVVDRVPIYPGCEKHDSQEKLKKCMSNKVIKHIKKNFNLDVFYDDDIPKGRYKIVTAFKIDAQGNVKDVNARSQFDVLTNEAIRVIRLLPKVIPGKSNLKNIVIPYSIPIELESFISKKDRERRARRLKRREQKKNS